MDHCSRTARAPGRVNLIGDHTDYNGGLALPMAIDLSTEVTFTETGAEDLLCLTSYDPHPARFSVHLAPDPLALATLEPPWARLAGAVTALAHPPRGGVARVVSTVPTGAGLSSSAAFSVALAMALGVHGPPTTMAVFGQAAEALVGSAVGLMDPLVISGALEGHALLLDFSPDPPTTRPVRMPPPEEVEVVVVHSGVHRILTRTPYAARRTECEAAALELGYPLGQAEEADLPGFRDPVLRRRTRHVITECQRVREVAEGLEAGDLAGVGRLLVESHCSLADDFEASTPVVDALVEELCSRPGVLGARMTGGGFGGCVVALTQRGALDPSAWPAGAWRVVPAGGAVVSGTPSDGRTAAPGAGSRAGDEGGEGAG